MSAHEALSVSQHIGNASTWLDGFVSKLTTPQRVSRSHGFNGHPLGVVGYMCCGCCG